MPVLFRDLPIGARFAYAGGVFRRKCVDWASVEGAEEGAERWFPNCEFVDPLGEPESGAEKAAPEEPASPGGPES